MASIFSIFSCCLQRKPSIYPETPNENSHLIPATTDPTPSPTSYVVDHQKLKERMSHIVRSKEGKMVNVNSRLPFNLHNKKLSVAIDPSSSSRSASTSTNRPSLNFSPHSASSHLHGNIKAHVGAPLTQQSIPAYQPPSRSSSLASRETSANESDRSYQPSPIFNVRLVHGIPPSISTNGQGSRRGRAKQKVGSPSSATMESPRTEYGGEGRQGEDSKTSVDSAVDENTPRIHELHSSMTAPNPTVSISPASTLAFKLQDTGPLTVSWGD